MTPEESNNPTIPVPPALAAASALEPWTAFLGRLSERQMVVVVCLFGLLLYLPMAGSYGLWDPWETHYGEVAREMVARGDTISLYWAGSPIDPEVFWSKPVLSFWLISLSMLVFGLGHPEAGTFALSSRPEWALRLPFILMSLLALAGVYLAVSRFVSRRAGVLSTLALATCPLFSLVARQAMTDMAFVGPMTLALALGALALFDDEDRELPRRSWGRLSWPHHVIFYLTVGLVIVTVLPQLIIDLIDSFHRSWQVTEIPLPGILPLAIGLTALLSFLFRAGLNRFFRRKVLAWSLPQIALGAAIALVRRFDDVRRLTTPLFFVAWVKLRQPILIPAWITMSACIVGFFAFLFFASRIRYKAPFFLMIAAILCGLAILAKGLAGLGLPVIVFLAYLFFTWNWRRLNRAQLIPGLWLALLACALVSVPWHHAMLARHGFPFWNELYGDNHWRRLVLGRHGDRGSFEYFLRELGYGLYPWIALVPAALSWVVMRTFRPSSVATGPSEDSTTKRRAILHLGAIWFVACYAVVSCSMTKFHHYILPAIPGVAIVLGCFVDDLLKGARARVVWLASLVGLPLLFLVTTDLVLAQKNAQHFIWLFCYDYINTPQGRPWPPALDYRIALAIFAGLFAVASLLLGWRRVRNIGLAGIALVSIAFTYFLLDSYMKDVSDRWSQKPLVATYYKERASSAERLVAWQMYWRGETFYTQNEIFEGPKEGRTVFLGDRNAEDLKDYLKRIPGKRVFFVVERTRFETLRGLLPETTRSSLKVVDDRNNKFYLASAQM